MGQGARAAPSPAGPLWSCWENTAAGEANGFQTCGNAGTCGRQDAGPDPAEPWRSSTGLTRPIPFHPNPSYPIPSHPTETPRGRCLAPLARSPSPPPWHRRRSRTGPSAHNSPILEQFRPARLRSCGGAPSQASSGSSALASRVHVASESSCFPLGQGLIQGAVVPACQHRETGAGKPGSPWRLPWVERNSKMGSKGWGVVKPCRRQERFPVRAAPVRGEVPA